MDCYGIYTFHVMPIHPSENTSGRTPRFLRAAASLTLAAALSSWLAGCSTRPIAPPAVDVPARLSETQSQRVTIQALGLVGTPYRYGGNTPDGGFDCSGLIGYVYRTQAALSAPRTVAALQGWGQAVPDEQVRTGDLVLFGRGNTPTHAGIYVGEGRFVHAPSTGGRVRLDRLNSPYWSRQQVAYVRP